MPYYLPAQQSILGPLIGAAATYFQTKDATQQNALQRQMTQMQMQHLPEQYAQEAQAAKDTSAHTQAETGYLGEEEKALKAQWAPFPGYGGSGGSGGQGGTDLSKPPPIPNLPPVKGTGKQRIDGLGKYVASLQSVNTFYMSRLNALYAMPQSEAVKSQIADATANISDVQGRITAAETEANRIADREQSESDRQRDRIAFMELAKSIPQARISISTGSDKVDYGALTKAKRTYNDWLSNPANANATPQQKEAAANTILDTLPNGHTQAEFESYAGGRATSAGGFELQQLITTAKGGGPMAAMAQFTLQSQYGMNPGSY